MRDPIALATMNNVLQTEAVLSAVGSPGTFTASFWSNNHAFDIPYANGATLGGPAEAGSHYAAVEALTASRPAAATYVMDSRAALDLTGLGYEVRIADEWFIREPSLGQSEPAPESSPVEIILTGDDLAGFERASVIGFGGEPPDAVGHTYPPGLLADDRFTFFGIRIDGEWAAGVFLFEDPGGAGVFTLFTLPAHRGNGHATALLQAALACAPDKPIATNPSSMSRRIFEKLGFRPVGERRIWAR